MNWQALRYPVIVFLILLIPYGLFAAWRDGSAIWPQIQQDENTYDSSPGCIRPPDDTVRIDPHLPPCTTTPAVVVQKTTHQEANWRVNANGQETVFDLAVRDRAGRVYWYHNVYDNFWTDRQIGETILQKHWQGQIVELDAGRDSYSLPPAFGQGMVDLIKSHYFARALRLHCPRPDPPGLALSKRRRLIASQSSVQPKLHCSPKTRGNCEFCHLLGHLRELFPML